MYKKQEKRPVCCGRRTGKRIYRINQRVLKLPIECTMKQTNSHNQVMAVALTGHRSIPYDKVPSLRKALRTVILEHYNRGIRIFYCGMLCKALHKQPYVH